MQRSNKHHQVGLDEGLKDITRTGEFLFSFLQDFLSGGNVVIATIIRITILIHCGRGLSRGKHFP